MKKNLTRILSTALIACAVAAPVVAQMAKKVKANDRHSTTSVVTTKALKSVKSENSRVHVLPAKTASKSAFSVQKTGKIPGRANMRHVLAAEGANIPTIYASLIFSEEEKEVGLYKLPQTDGASDELVFVGPAANYGGIEVDGVYYATEYVDYGFFAFSYVDGYDMATGEQVCEYTPPTEALSMGMDVDPVTGNVYGITFNSSGNGFQLSKLDYTYSSVSVTTIGALAGNWNSFAIDKDGQFYGIQYDFDSDAGAVTGSALYKIDRETAALTKVGDTGLCPQYLSSACIDKKTNRMFWSVNPPDEMGYLYEVNLATGEPTLLLTYTDGAEYVGMICPAPAAEDGAPAEVTGAAVNFTDGNLSGTLTCTAPATLFDGTAGTGDLTVKVLVDGVEAGSVAAQWGAAVSVPVSVAAAGKHNFTVYAENATGPGPKTNLKNIWVGADTPAATTATLKYVNGNMEVSWLPVTSSVNGGYLDLSKLSYKVLRADGSVAAEGLTTTSFSEAVAEPASITSYTYSVIVVVDGIESLPAETNSVVLGSIVPPYYANFDDNGFDGWTVIDANGDGKTWMVSSNNAARISYNTSLDMDDWLITPPIKVEKGKSYTVSFDAYGQSASWPEKLEVKFGTGNTAADMTSTVVAPTDIQTGSTEPMQLSGNVVPEEDGTIFVGFHGISDADQYYLYVANVIIEAGVEGTAPAAVEDLTVTPGANGALNAKVAFKAPSKAIDGTALTSLDKIEVYRNGELIDTFNNPTPGAALTSDDTLAEEGDYTYRVVAYNESGAGLPATVTVYVGMDLPADLTSVEIGRTAVEGEVVLNWPAVTTDVNGNPVDPANVTYSVYIMESYSRTPVVENISATTYTFQAVAAGEQDFVQYAVFPYTTRGEGAGAISDMIPVGAPYDGITESFPNQTLNYIWGLRAINGGSVSLMNDESGIPSQDGDNGFIGISGQYLESGADFFSGLVSLDGMVNPTLSFYTYNIANEAGDPDINELTVNIRTIDGANQSEYEEVLTGTVEELCGVSANEWGKVSVSLANYANKTIQFQITGIVKYYVYTVIDNIKVGSTLDNELVAQEIVAPSKVKAGEDFDVTVSVLNDGANDAASYTVELYVDGSLYESKALENLASGKTEKVPFTLNMSPIATEAMTMYAKVVYDADENVTNNQTSDLTVTPIIPIYPTVTDLDATYENSKVELTWTAPNIEAGIAEPITEDFEDADSFSATYGNWTFVDVDDSAVGGFQGTEIPGITVGSTKGSFWIWDQSMVGNQTFEAHSGYKYLFALFRYDDGQSDDWAISPELCGDAQTISFYARSYSAQYPEKISVYYSTTGTNPEDFVMVEGSTVNPVPDVWTEYTADLPDGAKYFAIRSYATGSFMLMVDDVTYTPADVLGTLEIEGYNIYRDGVKINDALVTETSYSDANVAANETYNYVVTVVYKERGESKGSEVKTVTTSGDVAVDEIDGAALAISVEAGSIVVKNAEGVQVVVSTIDGAVVYSGAGETETVVKVESGVYVVVAGNKVAKVIVK